METRELSIDRLQVKCRCCPEEDILPLRQLANALGVDTLKLFMHLKNSRNDEDCYELLEDPSK